MRRGVVFDVGNVLYDWDPRHLYRQLIADDAAREDFLAQVTTLAWHARHDAGEPFAATAAELIARHPDHAALIRAWGERFSEQIAGPVPDMPALVAELDAAGVPLFAITNFSGEFFRPFRAQEAALFDRFRDIVVSGDERLMKPDPAIFALALDRFGDAADGYVFVDDNRTNVAAAADAGMTALHFVDEKTLRIDLRHLGLPV